MKCPRCGAWTSVLETRTRADGSKRRRYECANLHRFTTVEYVDPNQPIDAPSAQQPANKKGGAYGAR